MALLLALASPLSAQVRPQAAGSDPRVQIIEYRPDQVVQLMGATGYQITVALGDDERIDSVAVGDSAAWQVTADKRGNHLFVKPVQPGVSTNMVVITDTRMYTFELVPAPGPSPDLPFAVRFVFPAVGSTPVTGGAAAMGTATGRYKLSGDKTLRPSGMADDGARTFIEWPVSAALPAIYAVDARGVETLVSGQVRGGMIVVDSIWPRYVFRQDRRAARAARVRDRR